MSRPCSLQYPLSLRRSIKLSAAADEEDLFRYVVQSFRAFEQGVFAKACEKSSTARRLSQDGESGEEEEGIVCPFLDGPMLSEVSDAIATGLQELMAAFEPLEEAVDR